MTCFIILFSSVFLLGCAAHNICGPNESLKNGIDCNSDCCPEPDGQATACPDPCATSCKCNLMYRRAPNGICIRSRECPPIPCGENEEFESCPVCSESCDNATPDGRRCPRIGRIGMVVICDPKCRCKDNYWRNKENKCVTYDQCRCNENERETSCINSVCEYRNCTDIGKPISCVRLDPKNCMTGCICIENYLRANNGTCIKEDQCPRNTISSSSTLAAAAAHSSISSGQASANAHASSHSSTETEDKSCEDDDNGFEITQPTCGKNEIYDICPAPCPPKRCDVDERVIRCKAPPKPGDPDCKPGCRCIDNYYKNDKNVCVPKNECPKKCKKNEVFDICPPQCPPQKCGVDPALILCAPNPKVGDPECKPGCQCIDGYNRNDSGDCIPKNKCPPKVICGPDEEYSSCVNGGCGRWNCSQPGIICIDLIEGGCREGCRCKDTYLRADNGTCIPADQCPLKCYGQNEVPGCDSNCPPQTCESIGKIFECPLEPAVCKPVCQCKEGFYRNKIGNCISEEDCLKCTGPNEYFSCGSACDNECSDLSQNQTNCPIINIVCNKKCYCEEGYARDDQNICIPIEECPPPKVICGPNEEYSSCVNGGCGRWNCSQPGIICIDPIKGGCREGCRCKDTYLRADNGTCIPADQCPLKCYGQNEVPGCDSNCPPQTCESIGKIYECPLEPAVCKPVCQCKEGFYRNKIGNCISEEDCLKCTGPNEYFSCGSACDNECSDLSQNQTNCPIINIVCNKKCYCEEGYARDHQNICIPIEECPPPKVICGPNEEYSSCVNGGCGRWNCSQPGIICIDPIKGGCREGCRCKDTYLRADNGTCIPADQCPLKCYGQNEVPGCDSNCPPQTCESIGKIYECPLEPAVCKPVCQCKEGFYRNKIGNCISEEDCLKCTGPNEYFSCGSACDNECSDLSQNQTNCPIINIVCNKKCYCEEGYARDDQNICIPIEECPPPKVICGPNEEYSSCVNGGCGRWNCSQPGIICIDPIKGGCREGCRCKDTYLRADNGTCIPADQCPLTCYRQNEVAGCDSCSPQTCDSIGKSYHCPLEPAVCKPVCRCKKGFYKNDNGDCVSKKDCQEKKPTVPVECSPESTTESPVSD